MTLNGITYEVISTRQVTLRNGQINTEIQLRRLNGRRSYYVVQYPNGSFSPVV